MFIPKNILEIIEKIEILGYEVYIVGGAVRDFLLGKEPIDYDLTTNALPNEIKAIFQNHEYIKVYDVGIKHGTLTLCNKGFCVEITTYRIEAGYLDMRHPDDVSFVTNIVEDLKRRDFTINAICYRNKIYDPLNAQADIKNKIIKAIGDPDQRFKEDALRIIRGIRFAAVLGFDIEINTKISVFKNKKLLEEISIERVREEFDKILLSNNSCYIFNIYYDVFFDFFSELGNIYNIDMNFNILKLTPNNIVLKLVGFLYSIILNTNQFIEKIDYKFVINKILKNFKYSSDVIHRVLLIIEYINLEFKTDKVFIKKMLNKIGVENLINLVTFKVCLSKIHKEDDLLLQKVLEIINKIIVNNEVYSLKQLNINGNDLVLLGIKEGPKIGYILNEVLQLIINEKLSNEKNIICNYIISTYL